VSTTPIIDRLEPLPAPKHPVDWGSRAGYVAGGVLSAMILLSATDVAPPLTGWVEDAGAWLAAQGGARFLLLAVVVLILGVLPIVAIHEGGHVLCGRLAGFAFASVRIGPLLIARDGRVSRYRGPNLWDGQANMVPRTLVGISRASALLLIGGPAANIATGALMIAFGPRLGTWATMFGWYSCVIGTVNLLPLRMSNGPMDGMRLLRILTRPDWTAQWHGLLMLGDAAEQGVHADEYPSDAVRAATGIVEDTPETMLAFWLAYAWAYCRDDYATAERFLETSLRHSARGAPPLRDVILYDVVSFVGHIRRDPELTERWAAELPVSSPIPGARARVDAALAMSRGDWDTAIARIGEVEQAVLPAIANETVRERVRAALERWRRHVRQLEREHGTRSIGGVTTPMSMTAG
jgi:hypothetical protein